MNKISLIRLLIFSILLTIILFFYANLNLLTFSSSNIDNTLPEPNIKLPSENKINNNASLDDAKKLNYNFELVGIRGNNPDSTIIILDSGKYRLINQGDSVVGNISFERIDGSRAYFYNGQEYSYLDIIGTEESFNKSKLKPSGN